jgi:hypothetical protein
MQVARVSLTGVLAVAEARRQKARAAAIAHTQPSIQLDLQLLNKYEEISVLVDAEDAIVFWRQQRKDLAQLAVLALQVLSVLPSGAGLERVFSQGGIVTSGRRCRLAGQHLEREILMRCNKNLLK